MEKLARDMSALSVADQIYLHFALGKAFADTGNHKRSFRHLLDGNGLQRGRIRYDEATTLRQFERMQASITVDLVRRNQGMGDPSRVPVFIIGMTRSDSTLTEQILASHPMVFGAGEIGDFEQALAGLIQTIPGPAQAGASVGLLPVDRLRQVGANYLARIRIPAADAVKIVNKTLGNFRFVGLIHLALPNARIIHMRRNPVDTCLSCFSQLFARDLGFTYDLAELGRFYRAYEALMAHWRQMLPPNVMLDLDYEDLVSDPEGQARRLVAHCGLEWDARCLAFHRTDRPVRTASTSQVRRPIYQGSVGRWRAVQPFLGPLMAALAGR